MSIINIFYILLFPLFINCSPVDNSKQVSVIIDCDAGADDAIGLLMILSKPKEFNVEAITCVQGNTGIDNVINNVLHTLAIANRFDIPVYVGSPSGLVYSVESDNFFGLDGFGDFLSKMPPNIHQLQEGHAALELARRVEEKPGAIAILALGPLTNLALAQHLNPLFLQQAAKIVIMGGSYKGVGNVAPGVEYNIYADPDAAQFIFSKPSKGSSPIRLLTYESCTENTIPMDWRRNVLGKLGSTKIDFLNNAEKVALDKSHEWLSCDPLAAAVLMDPNLVKYSKIGKPTVNTTTERGQMNVTFGEGFVDVIIHFDVDSYKKLLLSTLS